MLVVKIQNSIGKISHREACSCGEKNIKSFLATKRWKKSLLFSCAWIYSVCSSWKHVLRNRWALFRFLKMLSTVSQHHLQLTQSVFNAHGILPSHSLCQMLTWLSFYVQGNEIQFKYLSAIIYLTIFHWHEYSHCGGEEGKKLMVIQWVLKIF